MPHFSETFLDEIKQRVTLEQVARAHGVDLRREGAEFKGLSPWQQEKTPSFTINPGKGIWKDFSSGRGGNDVFSLKRDLDGSTFVRAVEELAAMAGVAMPNGRDAPTRRNAAPPLSRPAPAADGDAVPARDERPRGKRKIAKTYDYQDGDGGLLYQVCRFQFELPDGTWEINHRGRIKKTFAQRRPAPGEPGRYIWGLDAGEYMRKGPGADWYRYDEDNYRNWKYTERLTIDDGVAHGLYLFPELIEERAQGEDARIIWLPEGEKDVDTLTSWGLVATTNSGGAKNWHVHHAQQFAGLHVVVPIDNDKAGRERGHKVAASLRGWAASVKVLDWREFWSDVPEGGDITDWREAAQGSRDKLLALVGKLTEWTPAPPETAFNAQRFVDLDRPGREYEWLIKHLITRGETSVWYGPPGCGKSFLIMDGALAVARGVSWFNQRVRQGLVIYIAAEGGLGMRKRLRAWRKEHNVTADENLPFVLLPVPINIFIDDKELKKLLIEIRAWAAFYDVPLELVVFDTLAAVSAGANENSSEHMGLVLARTRWLAMETGAHVALVHHTPAQGDNPRGWTGIVGNVENVIRVTPTEQLEFEDTPRGRIGRKLRKFVTTKQKDEEGDFARTFVIKQVALGTDADGEPVTSCVVAPVYGASERPDLGEGGNRTVPAGYKVLTGNSLGLMKDLVATLKTKAATRKVGDYHVYVVKVSDWQETSRARLYTNDPDDPAGRRLRGRVKKAIERTYDGGKWDWITTGLIEKDGEFVWRTDRKVHGIDPPPLPPQHHREPDPMLLAPGEDPADDSTLI